MLPIVLYNGESRWRAATDLSVLIEPVPAELSRYQLQQQFEALVTWLQTPEQTELRRAFIVWLRRVALPDYTDEVDWEQVKRS